jgi:hypothetical protein
MNTLLARLQITGSLEGKLNFSYDLIPELRSHAGVKRTTHFALFIKPSSSAS